MKKSIFAILLLLLFCVKLISQNNKDAIFTQCIEDHILFLKKEKGFLNQDHHFYLQGEVIPLEVTNTPNHKLVTGQLLKVKTKRRNGFYVIGVKYVEVYGVGKLSIIDFWVKKDGRKKYHYINNEGSEYKITTENGHYVFTKMRQRN
jgi:hypothetical protein